jgi:hypothetical protein
MAALRENLPTVAKCFFELIRAIVHDDTMYLAVTMGSLTGEIGFIRGNLANAYRDQTDFTSDVMVPPMADKIELNYYNWTKEALVGSKYGGLFPNSVKDWLRMIPGKLTSKSAGLTPEAITLSLPVGGEIRDFEVKANSKFLAWLVHGNTLLKWENLRTRTVSDINPGITGNRVQISRFKPRLVSIIQLWDYMVEIIFASALQSIQATKEFFTIKKESGRALFDMNEPIIHSNRAETYQMDADYGQFDLSIRWAIRRFKHAGMMRAFEEGGHADAVLGELDGELVTLRKLLDVVHNNRKMAWFKFKNGNRFGSKMNSFPLNQNNTGEASTLETNNGANKPNIDQFHSDMIEKYPWYRSVVRFSEKYQGDDSRNMFRFQGCKPTADQINMLLTQLQETTASDGFDINPQKTGFRSSYGSYLQKVVCYGKFLPKRDRIQVHIKEKVTDVNEVEKQIARFSLLSEKVSRGGRHGVNLDYGMFYSFMESGIRSRRDGITTFTDMPTLYAYCPISMGGAGGYATSLMGANKDAVLYLLSNGAEKALIDQVSHVMQGVGVESKDAVVQGVLASGSVAQGVSDLADLMSSRRGLNAKLANDRLKQVNGFGVAKPYSKVPELMVGQILKDDHKFREIARELNDSRVRDVRSRTELVESKSKEMKTLVVAGLSPKAKRTLRGQLEKHDDILIQRWDRLKGATLSDLKEVATSVGRSLLILAYLDPPEGEETIFISEDKSSLNFYDQSDPDSVRRFSSYIRQLLPSNPEALTKKFRNEFFWVDMMDYEWGEPLDEKHSEAMVAGLDDDVNNLMRKIGASAETEGNAVFLTRIFSVVTSDPHFPDYYTEQDLFEAVTHPSVMGNEELMILSLEAMGAMRSKAQAAVKKLSSSAANFVFDVKTDSFSSRDQIAAYFDKTTQNIQDRLVSRPSFGEHNIAKTMDALGALAVMVDHGRSEGLAQPRSIKLFLHMDRFHEVMKQLTGKFGPNYIPSGEVFPLGLFD